MEFCQTRLTHRSSPCPAILCGRVLAECLIVNTIEVKSLKCVGLLFHEIGRVKARWCNANLRDASFEPRNPVHPHTDRRLALFEGNE